MLKGSPRLPAKFIPGHDAASGKQIVSRDLSITRNNAANIEQFGDYLRLSIT